jgi:DNA-binding response OmpR family regulator
MGIIGKLRPSQEKERSSRRAVKLQSTKRMGYRVGFRLLLVNNETQTGRIFKQAAPVVGAELIATDAAETAARCIRDERFDGIFVGADVPNFSRQGFTHLVRKSKFNSQTPVFLLTGYTGSERVPGKESDSFSRVAKPSSAADLLPFLKELKRKLVADRRKHGRLAFRTDVNCTQGARRFRAMSVNLSTQGMLIETSWRFEGEDELEIHFLLTEKEPVFRARVRVARVGAPNRVGVAFHNLGANERQRLRQFLDQHLLPRR